MSDLNFKPAAGGGFAGDKVVPVPALDTGASAANSGREGVHTRQQRRRLNLLRFPVDQGFRPFRVY